MRWCGESRASRGFTLIELMVSMTVALLIVIGVTTMLVQTKTGFKYQEAQSKALTDGSAAVAILEQELRLAGYPSDELRTASGVLDSSTDASIGVTYEAPEDNYRNCAGTAATAGDTVTVVFTIGTDGGISGLLCNGSILAENVTGLVFAYGEDADTDGVPDAYVAAASVGNFRNVIAVRATLTIDVPHDDLPDKTITTTVPLRNQVL